MANGHAFPLCRPAWIRIPPVAAWMLGSTALVMLMTPGLALFYGGMVRGKNVLNMLMQSFIALGVVTILWIVIGYSLAFSSGNAFIGGLAWMGLKDVGATPNTDY